MKISQVLLAGFVVFHSSTVPVFSQEGRDEKSDQTESDQSTGKVTILKTITVTDDRDSAWESPDGYVTTRSGTATMTDTQLIDTPASVSVITRDEMEARDVQSVSQALRYVPGTLSESRPSARYDSVFMRGFGGFGQTTNFIQYLDGLKLPRGTG